MHSGGFNPIAVYAALLLFVATVVAVALLVSAAAAFLTDAVGPAWVPLAAFVLLAVAAYVAWAGRRRAARSEWEAAGRCPACGYDLRATPERCPECGAVPDRRDCPGRGGS
jgi:protein-S-isoprenylcysteine O-methyltransferase Ste14